MQQFLNKGGLVGLQNLHIIKKMCLFIAVTFIFVCTGCVCITDDNVNEKITIVTTTFPPYDFVRELAGENAEISMLLRPGMESHAYEPSPADIIAIENCDLFIYNGGESDAWVETLIENLNSPDFHKIKMIECVDALEEDELIGTEEHNHHEEGGTEEHNHHEEGGTEEHNHHEEGGTAEYDEHVWTSPLNAIKICENILNELINIDIDNKNVYQENFLKYQSKLYDLDREIRDIVRESDVNTMIFADRFPFRYFAEEYDIEYRAAFPGCSSQSEPSVKTVAYLVDKIKQDNIKNIFYIEFSNKRLANAIQEETGAVPLLFHSCHNVTVDELNDGCTYLSLMKNNIINLKEALCNDTN